MEPNRVGRILGIGTRVVAGKLRDGTAGAAAAVERGRASRAQEAAAATGTARNAAAASGAGPAPEARVGAGPTIPSSAQIAEGSRRFARGAGRAGAAIWKPFAYATGQLTLQITGLLFAFFALGFGAKSWQLYRAAGWRDHSLPMYLGFGALFLWFAVSSFWRAGRKKRRG